ncbi:MAG: hypothetical protein AAGJ82_09720 [Bacteroidota bacterium]
MKNLLTLLIFGMSLLSLTAQEQRPSYCDELPVSYEAARGAGEKPRDALPRFSTTPIPEYKVQVAVLRFTDPTAYPFHKKLIARYRPCEEIWVIESRESFSNKNQALALRNELRGLGYRGAYLVEMMGYR